MAGLIAIKLALPDLPRPLPCLGSQAPAPLPPVPCPQSPVPCPLSSQSSQAVGMPRPVIPLSPREIEDPETSRGVLFQIPKCWVKGPGEWREGTPPLPWDPPGRRVGPRFGVLKIGLHRSLPAGADCVAAVPNAEMRARETGSGPSGEPDRWVVLKQGDLPPIRRN